MPFVQAKCTNCGANLEVDNTKDAAICPYCGSAYIVEKAINNYNVTNHITASTVNIYGGNSADFVIRGGVLEKYTGAQQSVTIPSSVIIIGSSAFSQCRGLKEVLIPHSVEEIEEYAFAYCDHLTSVVFHKGLVKIGNGAFRNCNSLTSVVFPEGLVKIGNEAFCECKELKSICFPKSLREIGNRAFRESGLTQIYVTSSNRVLTATTPVDSITDQEAKFLHIDDVHLDYDETQYYDTPIYWSLFSTYRGKKYQEREEAQRRREEAQRKQEEAWRRQGRCTKCGSPLKGFFSKTCTNPKCSNYERGR